jgi:chemotaxis protein histidine kinase CheA
MGMPDIGPVTAKADFKFDISKPRTAIMRKKLGGKLPIGEVKAHVDEAKYKFVKVTNIDVNIVSNGAIAEGDLFTPGKFADISCAFSFTNTNEMQKTKIYPRVRFNIFGKKKSDAEWHKETMEKAALKEQEDIEKAARKEQKAKEKAARKEQKAKEKAARKQQEALEDAAREKQREAEKQRKAEEKAAKKAAKAEAKAAKKAAKEAEKAAKKAAKEAAKKAAQGD